MDFEMEDLIKELDEIVGDDAGVDPDFDEMGW